MNKYKLLILICFFLLTISLPNVTASINNLNLLGKIIVLDAGHGGTDSGAKNGKIVEKELNLLLVKKLEKELISRGATVYLTREEDNDLSARTSERKSWKGLQVFYNKNNEENKVIAETITNNLKNNINNIREVKEENKYYMYKYIKYPGVLIEAGFISNPDENYLLRQEEYQNKLITLIADAIEKYYQK